jgi:hypothetical protein
VEVTTDQPTDTNAERDTPGLTTLVSSMQLDEPTQPEQPPTVESPEDSPAPEVPLLMTKETIPDAGDIIPEDLEMTTEVPIPNPRRVVTL